MAVSARMFEEAPVNAYKALITDISAAGTDIKVLLMTDSAAPSQATWTSKADVTSDGNEVVATGYTAGGMLLANKTLAAASRVTKFDADNTTWTSSTITARHAIVYDAEPVAEADQKLLVWIDFGADVISTAGDFTIAWHGDGIFTDTVAA